MKNLIIVLSLVIGISAHAELKIGDSARYVVGMSGQTFELLNAVAAIDTVAGKFTVNQTIFQNGSAIQQGTNQEDISSNTSDEGMFDACLQLPAELNPKFETVKVLAGSFSSCHVVQTDPNGTVTNAWFAKVVFGLVKMTKEHSIDNSDMTVELKEFKKN